MLTPDPGTVVGPLTTAGDGAVVPRATDVPPAAFPVLDEPAPLVVGVVDAPSELPGKGVPRVVLVVPGLLFDVVTGVMPGQALENAAAGETDGLDALALAGPGFWKVQPSTYVSPPLTVCEAGPSPA